MAHILPVEITRSLDQQWPCRELQVRQLAGLLSPAISSPSTLVLYGISATCKSTITCAVLSALEVPHAIIRCAECITGRHLLTKILLETLRALGLENEWERFGKGKCEHVSTLAVLLADALSLITGKGVGKFVLVLDGIDRQREASQMLLSALARLGEVIPALSVVLILNMTPRPLFLRSADISHIVFPPYTRKEAITIITAAGSPAVDGISQEIVSKFYPQFVSTVYDSLVGPTAGTIPSFRSTCERLWPRFIQPVFGEAPSGRSGEWDFARLLVRNRAMFKQQGEAMLVHHIVPEEPTKGSAPPVWAVSSTPKPPSLPYFPTLILTSAYVASHTPPRLDTIFFSKFSSSSLSARNKRSHHRRRLKLLSQAQAEDDNNDDPSTPSKKKGKRSKTRITKSTLNSAFATSSAAISAAGGGGALTGPSTILTARPFTLERLLAIYHAIDPNPPANTIRAPSVADTIYTELATLRRLRLVIPASGFNIGASAADAGEKWCVNISGDWIGEIAREIGVEVGEWLAGGLD